MLHIVVQNFQIKQAPAVIFEAEHQIAGLPVEATAASLGNEAEKTLHSQQISLQM